MFDTTNYFNSCPSNYSSFVVHDAFSLQWLMSWLNKNWEVSNEDATIEAPIASNKSHFRLSYDNRV